MSSLRGKVVFVTRASSGLGAETVRLLSRQGATVFGMARDSDRLAKVFADIEGRAYSAGYCAAKHGLSGLTRALAVEYSAERLRVNAVCPGGMLTPQLENFSAPDDANFDLIMRTASPRGMMAPLDVANVIAFLASDAAAAVHGAVYRVDDGKGAG